MMSFGNTLLSSILLFFLFANYVRAVDTLFSLENKCAHPIWPGTISGNNATPLAGGGLLLDPNATATFSAPPGWSGRFWARTNCLFNPSGTAGNCTTGDCPGALYCLSGGAPPVTLIEFTLGTNPDSTDFYDVSLVDGYNVPVGVTPTGGCRYAGCVADLNGECPAELRVAGASGETVACRSACAAFGTPEYCCTGEHGSPETCSPTRYSRLFKKACPTAYSYAYDDASSTCTCKAGSDYRITFCPS